MSVIWLAPNVIVRAFELFDDSDPHEHVCPFVFSVPAVNVIAPTTVEPTSRCVSVRSDLLIVIEFAFAPTVAIVTVAAAPEFESNVTSSADVGTDAPPAPPDVADQCVVVAASQVPLPPTQKRVDAPPDANGITNRQAAWTTSTARPSRTCNGHSSPTIAETRGLRCTSLRKRARSDGSTYRSRHQNSPGSRTRPSNPLTSTRPAGHVARSATSTRALPSSTATWSRIGGGCPSRPPEAELQLPASCQRLDRPRPTQCTLSRITIRCP